ncbi:MAG: glycosyltransferase family 4 protein [Clostridium sp.]
MLKKILHVIAQYPDKTGSGVFLRALVNEGEKKGYTQAVIGATSKDMEVVSFSKEVKFFPVEFNSDKLNFNIVGMSDIMPYPSTKYSDLTNSMFRDWKEIFENTLERAINEFKPDIILSHHIWILTSIVAKMKSKAKLIVFSQGTELRQIELASKYKDEVLSECGNIDLICALNDYQKNKIAKVFRINKSKIESFGVGYNNKVFYKPYENTEKKDFIYVGKICKSKGVECLIKAFNSMNTDSKLYIVGSGADQEFARDLGKYNSKIIFTGHLSQNDLASLMRKCKTFILPSFYEGLPLVIMEALACRCKVIVSDIEGIRPWVGDIINNSNGVSYIPMPRVNVDVPFEDDKKQFILDIKSLMESSEIENINFNTIEYEIEKRSWEGYFTRLEKKFI